MASCNLLIAASVSPTGKNRRFLRTFDPKSPPKYLKSSPSCYFFAQFSLRRTDVKLENGKRLVCVEFDDTSHEKPHEILHEKDERIAGLQRQVTDLQEQLSRRDEQIDHFQQIVAMSQKNIAALTEQLDDSRQMIEDMRSRSWWKRILRR